MEDIWKKLHKSAEAVRNGRKISGYVEAGEVSAAYVGRAYARMVDLAYNRKYCQKENCYERTD